MVYHDFSMKKQTVSVIISVLPLSIRRRLSPVLSMATTRSIGYPDKPWHSTTSSGATTPFTEAETLFGEEEVSLDALAFTGAPSKPDMIVPLQATAESGIDWRCGRPGLELLISAVEESKNATSVRSGLLSSHDSSLERRAYVDGVSYLLRGLPHDLGETEVTMLTKALPLSVAGVFPPNAANVLQSGQRNNGYQKPSMLHKTTRNIVARAIVCFCIMWPYILALLRWMAAFERKHRVSDQLMAQAIAMVTACGTWAVAMSEAICSKGDGRLGQALLETVTWAVHDMVAGVSEGLQDGLSQVERPL